MVKYLDEDENLKNGYKLADILTRTCCVDGDEITHDDFCQKVNLTPKQKASDISLIKTQVNEDLANFHQE